MEKKKREREKYSIFKMFIQAAIMSMGQKETNKQTNRDTMLVVRVTWLLVLASLLNI